VATSLVNALPWAGNAKTDRFDVQVHFEADEHELIMAELAVTRFIGNKAVDVQRQKLQANLSQVVSRDSL
jgi:hypothetical protein